MALIKKIVALNKGDVDMEPIMLIVIILLAFVGIKLVLPIIAGVFSIVIGILASVFGIVGGIIATVFAVLGSIFMGFLFPPVIIILLIIGIVMLSNRKRSN